MTPSDERSTERLPPSRRPTEVVGPGSPEDARPLDRRLGPYLLQRRIGQGGMGSVYLALRDDEYRQLVAIKLVNRELEDERSVQRFRKERQILADLQHPHIARLLDGGTTDDGSPYLVMEYIEGVRIDEYCDAHRLSVAGRLRLLQQVCRAIAYAHRNLVVHRDLKPSNVMVDAEGRVRLLDFGIAELLSEERRGGEDRPADMAMTPEYASPEQVRGGLVTTATDVHALGLLLYLLLVGRHPLFDELEETSFEEVARVICDRTPAPPSFAAAGLPETVASRRGLGPLALARRLRGDLDAIALRALQKEPELRYPSVEQLSADIDRHLTGYPVEARRPTWSYRFGRFAHRHRLLLGFLTSLCVSAVALALLSVRLSSALDRASRASARATATTDFLVETLGTADPRLGEGRDVLLVDALTTVGTRVADELRDEPDVAVSVRLALGRTLVNLGAHQRSVGFLEEAVAGLREQSPRDTRELGVALNDLGLALAYLGDERSAERSYREGLALLRETTDGPDPDVAACLDNLGLLELGRGDFDAASALVEEALEMRRALFADADPQVAVSLNNRGLVALERGDLDVAKRDIEMAVEIGRRTLPEGHPDLMTYLGLLAAVAYYQGRLEDAASAYRDVLETKRRTFGDGPELVTSANNLAAVLRRQGNLAEAEMLLRSNVAMLEEAYGEEHEDVALALANLAMVVEARGELRLAEPIYRRAYDLRRRLLEAHDQDLARSAVAYAQLLRDLDRGEEAEALVEGQLDRAVASGGDSTMSQARLRSFLGVMRAAARDFEAAERELVEARHLLSGARVLGAEELHREVGERLVELYESWGRPEMAAAIEGELEAPSEP